VIHPKFSIVTPSYNQGEYLEEAILSVLDQRYPNLEYMVLDGGSTDNSIQIIKKYERHLTHWRSHPDDGQSAALREGFDLSSGEILNWLNSDDRLTQDALATVASAYVEHGPDIVVTGGCRVFGSEQEPVDHWPRFQRTFNAPEPLPVPLMLDMAKHWFPGEFFYQPEVFLPASGYREVGGVDPTIYYTMDYDLWMRLALAGANIVVTKTVLAEYREHPGQKTSDLTALHRQMIETANRYLVDGRTGLSPSRRRMLAISNSLSTTPPLRRGVAVLRGLLDG
jgi:glycosyltransferase involved in cell wall biosynthesis